MARLVPYVPSEWNLAQFDKSPRNSHLPSIQRHSGSHGFIARRHPGQISLLLLLCFILPLNLLGLESAHATVRTVAKTINVANATVSEPATLASPAAGTQLTGSSET